MVMFHERVHRGIFFTMRNAWGQDGPRKGRVLRCHFQGEVAWQYIRNRFLVTPEGEWS